MASFLHLSIVLLFGASIGACSSSAAYQQTVAQGDAAGTSERHPPAMLALDNCEANGPSISIDAYKRGVALHIVRSNLGHTFEGRLPSMLPAVVVLRLSVDPRGAVTEVFVQRSRDDVASQVALESVHRSGYFPSPCGLADGPQRSFSFSETFLFNDRYEFQLRSLAGPQ